MSTPLPLLALTAALLATPPLAAAQTAAPAITVERARTYTPADSTRYAPRSALDMLQQVPGFVIRDAVHERGLGQATGNVLLNGQRMTGKTNDVLAQLGKIPAANVTRIEIRDGAALGTPGLSGPVANVIAKAGGISGSWAWRPDVRKYFTDPQLTRGEVSISGARENIESTLGFDNAANHSGAGGGTTIYEPDARVRELRDEIWTGESDRPRDRHVRLDRRRRRRREPQRVLSTRVLRLRRGRRAHRSGAARAHPRGATVAAWLQPGDRR